MELAPKSHSKLWSWDLNLDCVETLLSLEPCPFTKATSAELHSVAEKKQGVSVELVLALRLPVADVLAFGKSLYCL